MGNERYIRRLQDFYQKLDSTPWELPDMPPPQRVSALELPYVGSDYDAGGLILLQSDPNSVSPDRCLARGIEAVSESSRGPLDFLFVAALCALFLRRYCREETVRQSLENVEIDLSDPAGVQRFISSLDQIAFGRMTQVHPGELSESQEREFRRRWLQNTLRGQLKILKPFHFVVLGSGSKAAWEIVSHTLEAVAWRRETDATRIGHIIALKDRELVGEVVFLDQTPSSAEELNDLLAEFRRFIDGGFLLGSQAFSFVTR
ncbi:MAG: hypothetical protein ACE5GA_04410 [Candidatus Zixiibacteriota bacterium]